ncbi:FAD-dependent oxidoreductase [Planctomonas deserti]|uniref:FAD-dependent oxidoreductase n=1 Tax=Planctomonas deserti TaxID=2144185 RepID=UPI001F0B7668|nr:NAD(P)/FAD-dependent oxidoreductase [Planctomonas deserti]
MVGAGPVGLMLAAQLAQGGADVRVFERRAERSAHSRAIGIHPPSLDALAGVGVRDAVVAEGRRITAGVGRCGGRDLGTLPLTRVSPSHPFVITLPQNRTEELLEARLEQLSPGALRRGVGVRSATAGEDGMSVQTEDGGELSARFVVAADGGRSTLRDAAGIAVRRRTHPDTYLMGDFPDDTADGDLAVLYLEPGGVVESFPLPGGVRRWVARTSELESDPSADRLARLVEDRTGERLEASRNTMLSAFSVQRGIAERLGRGRLLLAGDAAHEVSPIGGQGMNLGWLDAAALAPLVLAALRDGTASRPGAGIDAAAFARYERDRLRAARRAALLSEANMALGRPSRGATLALRNATIRALVRTPVRGAVASAFAMRWS